MRKNKESVFCFVKWFSRQGNDSASIVKCTNDRFYNGKMLEKAEQEAKQERHNY